MKASLKMQLVHLLSPLWSSPCPRTLRAGTVPPRLSESLGMVPRRLPTCSCLLITVNSSLLSQTPSLIPVVNPSGLCGWMRIARRMGGAPPWVGKRRRDWPQRRPLIRITLIPLNLIDPKSIAHPHVTPRLPTTLIMKRRIATVRRSIITCPCLDDHRRWHRGRFSSLRCD